ncbi:hypothetical protein H2248_011041 [Termitomyces sp. 'cryptogamus']|nr:hypothetical protein H2248_011041 [Termitomyces sp. 'cryptogamus']
MSSSGHLVEDILRRIFSLIKDGDAQWLSHWVAVGMIISRVSSQWRAIALDDSSLWTEIFIGHTSSPGMTRTVLKRSAERNLRIIFRVSEDMGGLPFHGFSTSFELAMHLVMDKSARWKSFSVVSPFFPLLHISKMVSQVPLPRLESMELVRSDTATTLHCGPFRLNSTIFRHLVLDGVIIRRMDSSQFSGLRSLSIANTDLWLLDEKRMESWTYATIPVQCVPTMTNVTHLSISAPFLTYDPAILSLEPSILVSLKLSRISADFLRHSSLIQKLLTEKLCSLELADIDSAAAALFFSFLQGRTFARLDTLTVRFNIGGLDSNIRSIFPKLINFSIITPNCHHDAM